MSDYPSKSGRNCSVEKAKSGFEHKLCIVAGRVIGILDDGFVLQDESSRMNIQENNDSLIVNRFGSEKFDVGYILEVQIRKEMVKNYDGKMEEIFIAENGNVLAPCLADFFIRKEDPNYLKMVIDLRLKDLLSTRQLIIKKIRDFFWERNFMEVETPQLVRLPGMEPYLDVFKTQFVGLPTEGNAALKEDLYLITSPEYAMKKLLVAGFENIFQITKSFRNKETESELHNPEFTILEWYSAYENYEKIMDDTEELFKYLALTTQKSQTLKFGKNTIDLSLAWKRTKVKDAFKTHAGINHEDFENVEKFRLVVKNKGYQVKEDTKYEDLFFMVFLNEVESKLGLTTPEIVFDYPIQMAALSKKCSDDPKYAERFEVYVAGMELCNAFTELNDPVEQKNRLEAEKEERKALKKDDYPVDQSFIRALEFGMPPSGGIALGVDRLVMLLTDTPDIRDILFFPHKDL